MKTIQKTERLNAELSRFTDYELKLNMTDVDQERISDLVRDAGYSSVTSFLNEHNRWSSRLVEVIAFLVEGMFTSDELE